MTEPAILFVKPGSVKPSDKGRLSKAGVIVVEIEDPAAVKFIRAGMELSSGALLAAAAHALNNTAQYGNHQAVFGEAVAHALTAAYGTKP